MELIQKIFRKPVAPRALAEIAPSSMLHGGGGATPSSTIQRCGKHVPM